MTLVHFAYGSNLWIPRLRDRVPGVKLIGPGRLAGHELRWHKRSKKDGSGKLSIVASDAPDAYVFGALFAIPSGEKRALDRAEGLNYGYDEDHVEVHGPCGAVTAQTYVAAQTHTDDSLSPYSWYRDLVVAGATALGAPPPYLQSLREVEVCHDPDPGREARERAYLLVTAEADGDFLRQEFHRLTLLGSLQRSSTYVPNAPDADRRVFRRSLVTELERIAGRYGQPVSDDAHTATIVRFSRELSDGHDAILRDGQFRIGVSQKAVNLFLKYLWCAGWIPMPPHCPFDSIVTRLLPRAKQVPWTKINSIDEYRTLVATARDVAGDTPLAIWELHEYSRLVAASSPG